MELQDQLIWQNGPYDVWQDTSIERRSMESSSFPMLPDNAVSFPDHADLLGPPTCVYEQTANYAATPSRDTQTDTTSFPQSGSQHNLGSSQANSWQQDNRVNVADGRYRHSDLNTEDNFSMLGPWLRWAQVFITKQLSTTLPREDCDKRSNDLLSILRTKVHAYLWTRRTHRTRTMLLGELEHDRCFDNWHQR
jgi:hypothetical protein